MMCPFNHKHSDKMIFRVAENGNCFLFSISVVVVSLFHACGMTNVQIHPPSLFPKLKPLEQLYTWLPFEESMTLLIPFDDSLIKGCFLALLTFCEHFIHTPAQNTFTLITLLAFLFLSGIIYPSELFPFINLWVPHGPSVTQTRSADTSAAEKVSSFNVRQKDRTIK